MTVSSGDDLDHAVDAAGYWANEARAAMTARDEAIAAAVDSGASQRAVARATGLSHPAIAAILRRLTAQARR